MPTHSKTTTITILRLSLVDRADLLVPLPDFGVHGDDGDRSHQTFYGLREELERQPGDDLASVRVRRGRVRH